MRFRIVILFLLLLLIGTNGFSQTSPQKSTSQLVEDLRSNNRNLSDSAIDELSKQSAKSLFLLLPIAEDTKGDEFIRVRVILVLGRIKNRKSVPTLINILSEKNPYITGASAYALSQLGGDESKNALLQYLKDSLKINHENLQRATEAIKELPDPRAFPVLMKILEIAKSQQNAPDSRNEEKDIVRNSTLKYAVEALGEIGDSRASLAIANFLKPDSYYVQSEDYVYLRAIYKTKGSKAISPLISYLEKIVEKLKGKEEPVDDLGAENKQIIHNLQLYKQTLDCLEAITNQKSVGSTREDTLIFWKLYAEVNNQSTDNR